MDNDLAELQKKHGQVFFSFVVQAFEYVFCRTNLLNIAGKESEKNIPRNINVTVQKKFEKDGHAGMHIGEIESMGVNRARQISSLPGNHFTPESFEKIARQIAKELRLKITVIKGDVLKRENLNGIYSVSKGSDEPGRLICLEYKGGKSKKDKTLCLVGKGLTFDAGGISLKPALDMHEMKYDMSGGAAVLYALEAIARLKINLNVNCIIASAENLPSGRAIKPGDVYTSHKGLNVEVQNCDAEGRLILADALSWASRFKPDYVVDIATLTGAIVICLGEAASGLMGNSAEFINLVKEVSEVSMEPVWELPLWEEFAEPLKSNIADVKNVAGNRSAGSIMAGKFLEKFIPKDSQWVHLDIAGTAWVKGDRGMYANGPTGAGVRLFTALARKIAGMKINIS